MMGVYHEIGMSVALIGLVDQDVTPGA